MALLAANWIFILLPAPLAIAGPITMRAGIGVLVTRQQSADPADSAEESREPRLACGTAFAFDFVSGKSLALGLGNEVWVSIASSGEATLTTVPILFGLRATMFPGSSMRLYGAASAGPCIMENSVTTTAFIPIPPFFISNTEKRTDSAFSYAVGGGIEVVGDRRSRLFSIDYRYLAVGRDRSLGGHVLCFSYGFLF
jgi:hypothetical protein